MGKIIKEMEMENNTLIFYMYKDKKIALFKRTGVENPIINENIIEFLEDPANEEEVVRVFKQLGYDLLTEFEKGSEEDT